MERVLSPRNGLFAILLIAILGALAFAAVALADNGDNTKDSADTPINGDEPLPPDSEGPELVVEPAPIEEVSDVIVAESAPPQYFVRVVSAQPSGCAQFHGYSVGVEGNRVKVIVNNTVPADLTVVLCTMEFKTTATNIPLGSDFVSGETYVLEVNGEVAGEFTAQ